MVSLGETCSCHQTLKDEGEEPFVRIRTAVDGESGVAGSPLSVANGSHVVPEYEAWFAPKAATFADAEAMPLPQSKIMQSFGGGYDSKDPHVIRQHVAWMQYMGIDAAIADVSNNVGCIFSTGPVSKKFLQARYRAFSPIKSNHSR